METALVTDRQGRLVGRLAMTFYGAAAAGAVVAQTWVAMAHVPWPDFLPVAAQLLVSLVAAGTLELLAVVVAVMSDYRMRLGERAVGLRVFSAAVAIVAAGVIVLGHWEDIYLATGFGTLSAAAYLLALVHMAARRRDALRAAGMLAQVPPSFGLYRWIRRPVLTARAAELARVQGLGLRESLRQAELELRAERRRPAIAAAVESAIRSSHDDPRMAEIAVSTLDLDRIAAELAATADYAGWAERLAPAVTAPSPDSAGDSPDAESADSPPLFLPDSWVSQGVTHPGDSPAESGGDSPGESDGESGGDSPRESRVPRQVNHRVTHRDESGESAGGESPVPDELIHRATAAATDPEVRMAWLWHASGGQASGRELARAGQVSASTGIRRRSRWTAEPPADPRR